MCQSSAIQPYFKARSPTYLCTITEYRRVHRTLVASLKRVTKLKLAVHVGPDLTSTKFTMPHVHFYKSPTAHSLGPGRTAHLFPPFSETWAPEGSVGIRMRMRTAAAHASQPAHAQMLPPPGYWGPEEGYPAPPRLAPPRPCRFEALLPALWSSLLFPTGWRLSLAFLSLCSRTSRDPCRNPWPGLRGWGAGRPPGSSLPVRSERSERWEVVLGMEPSCVGAELSWGCAEGNLGRQWALASSAELSAFRCPEGTALPTVQTGSFLDSTDKDWGCWAPTWHRFWV